MKTCPYCGTTIPEKNVRCPSCQADYWEPNQSLQEDLKPALPEQEEKGCLPILMLPVFLSAAVTAALILCGFIINLLVHFESNQIKILWIGISCLMGLIFFRITKRLKKERQ